MGGSLVSYPENPFGGDVLLLSRGYCQHILSITSYEKILESIQFFCLG